MEYFISVLEFLSRAPAFVPLAVLPALLPVCALLCALFKRRRAYPAAALLLGAAGFSMLCACSLPAAAGYLSLFTLLSGLFSPLLLLHRRKKREKMSRSDRLYGKFHEALEEPARPQKVCCFTSPPEGEGTDISHAQALIEKLKGEKLSAADRLELDAVARTVEGCANGAAGSGALLNDCLASILRLTAKYKL